MKLSDVLPGSRRARVELDRCPNQSEHVSAWPAFDRKLCPYCGKVYVRKQIQEAKGEK